MQTDNVLENYGKACASLEAMAALIGDQTPLPPLKVTAKPQFTCNVTEEQYTNIVEKTRDYIFNGDIFQAVQSRRHEPLCRQPALRVSRAPHHQSLAVHGVPFR